MTEDDLKRRTKEFALRVLKMAETLPDRGAGRVLSGQIMRSATSVAANYRAVCRAKSRADFVSKLGMVEEEIDETAFWLELTVDAGLLPWNRLAELRGEADELTAIFVRSLKTARDGRETPKSKLQNPK
ncbi:MAG TPA: four helix bundle protein [Opitutaceae bacterium]|nr:four helix bundle protein [Opitutaceae bacterium]